MKMGTKKKAEIPTSLSLKKRKENENGNEEKSRDPNFALALKKERE